MATTKIDGLENWGLPEGGKSREAKERALYEKEQGIDSKSLAENAVGRDQKALRESQVLRALGFEVDDLKRRERKSPGSITVADVVLLERRIETLKSNVAGRENNIAESVSLSEGQIIPEENGKKSFKLFGQKSKTLKAFRMRRLTKWFFV